MTKKFRTTVIFHMSMSSIITVSAFLVVMIFMRVVSNLVFVLTVSNIAKTCYVLVLFSVCVVLFVFPTTWCFENIPIQLVRILPMSWHFEL